MNTEENYLQKEEDTFQRLLAEHVRNLRLPQPTEVMVLTLHKFFGAAFNRIFNKNKLT